ncbi:MAG: hypothetical protein ABI867_18350 [Kofleriaceae bacterium]
MKPIPLTCAAVVALAAAPAFAQQAPAHAGPQTVLPNILNTGDGATVEVRLDYTHFDVLDVDTLGFTFQGQYITPGGFGVYGTIPFAYGSGEGDSASGLGNLEVGGLYVMHNSPDLDIFVRGGLAIDTADDDGTGLAPLAFLIPRLPDAFPSGADSNWLRLHGGVRTKGALVLGVQGGVDFPTEGDGVDGVFTLSASAGIVQPGFGLSAGIAYMRVLFDDTGVSFVDDDTVGFNAVIDFNATPKTKVFGAFGVNLDEIDDDLSVSLGGGVRIAL